MPCYKPLTAYRSNANGDVSFRQIPDSSTVQLPCGRCIGCRLERSRQWAMRCMHEASVSAPHNAFITLTYDDEHMPDRAMLCYPDYQRFMKRLRKEVGPVRFYMCGEYGEKNWRPHYHACIFGYSFPDKLYWATTSAGEKIYRSAVLERLWPFGYCSVGNVTFESAAYVARYCVQKVTGQAAAEHYRRVDQDGVYSLPPEFNQMSRKPGIGATWIEKYAEDVYNYDAVVVNGREVKPPRYYDKWLKRNAPDAYKYVLEAREYDAFLRRDDNTPERLAVKEKVALARTNLIKTGRS